MNVTNAQTAEFLRSAYGGESMAHMRYLAWGAHAEKEGFPNIARLYKAIAYAELVHAHNHFKVLGKQTGGHSVTAGGEFGMASVVENLGWAIEGEQGEVSQMYPVYLNAAQFQGENDAVRTFHYALEAEKIHVELFQKAQDLARTGADFPMANEPIHICPICGYTVVGDSPDKCPICNAKSAIFKAF